MVKYELASESFHEFKTCVQSQGLHRLPDGTVSATWSPLERTTCTAQDAYGAHYQEPRARHAREGDFQERLSRQAEISQHQTAPEASLVSVSLHAMLLLHATDSKGSCGTRHRTPVFVCSQQSRRRGRVEDS